MIIKSSGSSAPLHVTKAVSFTKKLQGNTEIAHRDRADPGRPPARRGLRRLRSIATDPDSGQNPRIDTYEIDLAACGPMVLDALIKIKDEIDSTLTFRRSCREGVCGSCSMNIDGTNWLACTRFISDMAEPATIYPLINCGSSRIWCPTSRISLRSMPRSSLGLKLDAARTRATAIGGGAKQDRRLYECILCFCCTRFPSHWWNGDASSVRGAPAGLALAGRQPRRSDGRTTRQS